jgi:signal transduction histidine kinase/DNA-binding response OmpR family regulator
MLVRRWRSTLLRLAALLSMTFATSFGFLAAITSPGAHYDPYSFAVGASALFGAACGALGLLISRLNVMRRELRALRTQRQSERVLLEARERTDAATRVKSRFLATVAHEIRTPLNGILGMSDLLLDTPLSPEQAAYTGAIKQSGEILLRLAEDVLDISQIEAGRLAMSARPFDLPLLVEETTELIAPRAQAKHLEIACYIAESMHRMVIGDPARLRQVLLNLTNNAIKFTKHGGIALGVERDGSSEAVRFSVHDTGIGIAPEAQGRIFREFEQVDAQCGGTGLGLAISKHIIEQMGGSIGVESTPGEGSLFHFRLPMPAAPYQPQLFCPPNLGGLEILILAPVYTTASLLSRRLTDWGAHIRLVGDIETAHDALAQGAWDAVMVDFGMGMQACLGLARQASECRQRIVLITPSQRAELPALQRLGFSGYLIKPVRAASLAARMDMRQQDVDFAPEPALRGKPIVERTGRGPAVLIAEDNEINALLAQALLTRLGHRVTLVNTGRAAVEAWDAAHAAGSPYDLLLMDVQMPDGTGIEAAGLIRAAEANAGRGLVPLFALTANAYEEDCAACMAAGMDGVLTKPLQRERLLEILARLSGTKCGAAA